MQKRGMFLMIVIVFWNFSCVGVIVYCLEIYVICWWWRWCRTSKDSQVTPSMALCTVRWELENLRKWIPLLALWDGNLQLINCLGLGLKFDNSLMPKILVLWWDSLPMKAFWVAERRGVAMPYGCLLIFNRLNVVQIRFG